MNIEAIIDDSDTPEDVVLKGETREDLLRALDKLPEIQRQLLFLKYEQGLSYQEIAHLQDIKVDKVRTYLYRARQNLYRSMRGLNRE
ncbi:MAG: RNA polymerase sigma factor [Alicyclobacillus macrosporangiidus]|nr:RNA polymerase sigma factor [Alicyclobacillus macrosporangiidus]